ncbi:MAG TPA: methyltransferase domain-containing protein [Verrucomicrobiota bacterium]|nr:methyltransferase domain-containing protein [Verrucomicrobiota bacterium]
MRQEQIALKLEEVASLYPAQLVAGQRADIPRIAFNIALSLPIGRPLERATLCDIGGGIGLFTPGCAAIGFGRTILVDDFGDQVNVAHGETALAVHRSYGVRIVSRDVVERGMSDLNETFDVVTCFDSMEHWHRSPKKLFHELTGMLADNGRFILSVPNCVNLRKRLSIPFGRGKWSAMKDWYEPDTFRGHVREPDVDDLRYIAADLGLRDVQILGRNWQGHKSSNAAVRVLTRLADGILRLRPSLCSDIYLVGTKSPCHNAGQSTIR